MIKHNYHAHSKYCNHSVLTLEESVQEGIKLGLETIGISEHTWLPNRIGTSRLKDEATFNKYLDDMDALKEKYKGQARILTGIESEIYNVFDDSVITDHINRIAANPRVDYVILGHHSYVGGKLVGYESPTQEQLDTYVKHFKEAVNNANILYVAHPDVLVKGYGKWTPELETACKEMIEAAVANDIPFGINVNGFLYGVDWTYPNINYFKLVAEAGGKGVIELDAHTFDAYKEENIQKAYNLAKEAGVEIIDKIL